MGKEW